MRRGKFTVHVPHACEPDVEEPIEVSVSWSHYPATRIEPEDWSFDAKHAQHCKCGGQLDTDERFVDAITDAVQSYDALESDGPDPDYEDEGPAYDMSTAWLEED